MSDHRLSLLYLSQVPPSPPRYGGQVRMHGLMTAMARRHDVTCVTLVDPSDDLEPVRRALGAYCREAILVPNPRQRAGRAKRLLQARSLASTRSFERLLYDVPALQPALDALLRRQAFDAVNVEFPYLAHCALRRAPPGAPPPRLLLDEHNVEYDVLRQVAASEAGLGRRAFNLVNWRKLRREEQAAWRRFDGLTVTSARDEELVRGAVPGARTAVIPNAVDVEFFRPRPGDPPPDGHTIVFFGAIGYFPNTDGILHFLDRIWPQLSERQPGIRLRIIGPRPPPAVLGRQGPRVEVTGFVDDLRPCLASAAAIIVPLRIGSGTRLKILEAMAMGKAVVSTALGAEGLRVEHGQDLLIADAPADFAREVARVVEDEALARRLGESARRLIEAEYSWGAAADRLEAFLRQVLEAPARG